MRHRSALVELLLAGGAAVAIAACGPSGDAGNGGGDNNGDKPDAMNDRGPRADARPVTPANDGGPDDPNAGAGCTKMDIVFVVDNSDSMDLEQESLGTNFPVFAKILDDYRISTGEPLDYRVAITTTARGVYYSWIDFWGNPRVSPEVLGEDGLFLKRQGAPRRWIEKADPEAGKKLAELAAIGIGGSHLEMPLEAARLALSKRLVPDPENGDNVGFLRPDALLAVVLLTDEEDCSREDATESTPIKRSDTSEGTFCSRSLVEPQGYVDFFDKLKVDRAHWATAVIAGDGAGRRTCSSAFGSADDAPRLKKFVELTGKNAIFRSICDGDLAPALKQALDTFQQACNNIPPVD